MHRERIKKLRAEMLESQVFILTSEKALRYFFGFSGNGVGLVVKKGKNILFFDATKKYNNVFYFDFKSCSCVDEDECWKMILQRLEIWEARFGNIHVEEKFLTFEQAIKIKNAIAARMDSMLICSSRLVKKLMKEK